MSPKANGDRACPPYASHLESPRVSLWPAMRYYHGVIFGFATESGSSTMSVICRIDMRVHSTVLRGTSFDQGAEKYARPYVPRDMVRRFLDAAHIARRQTAPFIE
jgi:hypothetical protein